MVRRWRLTAHVLIQTPHFPGAAVLRHPRGATLAAAQPRGDQAGAGGERHAARRAAHPRAGEILPLPVFPTGELGW